MSDTPFEVKPFLQSLTHRPGVYRMLDARHKVIYVGKARDLKKRVSSYFQRSQQAPKTAAMMEQVARVEVTVVNTEAEALVLEYNLIKQHKPPHNVRLKDDKSFLMLRLDGGEPCPRVDEPGLGGGGVDAPVHRRDLLDGGDRGGEIALAERLIGGGEPAGGDIDIAALVAHDNQQRALVPLGVRHANGSCFGHAGAADCRILQING